MYPLSLLLENLLRSGETQHVRLFSPSTEGDSDRSSQHPHGTMVGWVARSFCYYRVCHGVASYFIHFGT